MLFSFNSATYPTILAMDSIPEPTLSPSTPPSNAATRFSRNVLVGFTDPRVDVSLNFQIEQSRTVLGAIKLKRNGLIDRHSYSLGFGISVVADVDGDGLSLSV